MEVIIYMGLFSILMSGAVVASYQLIDSGSRNQTFVTAQEEGTFLNRKINWALTGATAVTSGVGTLTITRPDLGAQSPLVIVANGSTMTLSRGGSAPVVLNAAAFVIGSPSFVVTPATGGRPTLVSVSFLVGKTPFTFNSYLRQ